MAAWRNGRRDGFKTHFLTECEFDSHRRYREERLEMKYILSILIAVASVFAFAVPAQAHFVKLYNNNNYLTMDADHGHIHVHDEECDGNKVYATVQRTDGTWGGKLYDNDGCAGNGTTYGISAQAQYIWFCEENSGPYDVCTTMLVD